MFYESFESGFRRKGLRIECLSTPVHRPTFRRKFNLPCYALITPPQIGEAGLVVPLRQFEGVAGKFFPADRLRTRRLRLATFFATFRFT